MDTISASMEYVSPTTPRCFHAALLKHCLRLADNTEHELLTPGPSYDIFHLISLTQV